MKQASIVAGIVALTNANDNCCIRKKGMGELKPVKREWLCGEFRSNFERTNTQCKADIATFFEDLNEPIPASIHNINQQRTEQHIRKWFNFYCGAKTFDFEAERRVFLEKKQICKGNKEEARLRRIEREEKERREDQGRYNYCKVKREKEWQ